MARKGNQQRNGLDRQALNHKKGNPVSGVAVQGKKEQGRTKAGEVKDFPGEELPNGNHPSSPSEIASETNSAGDYKKTKQKSEIFSRKEKQGMVATNELEEPRSSGSNSGGGIHGNDVPIVREENGVSPRIRRNQDRKHRRSRLSCMMNGLHIKTVEFADSVMARRVRASVFSILKAVSEWLGRHKPLFLSFTTSIFNASDYFRMKIEHAYPVILKWLMHFGNIVLLISMVWLDCAIRGIDSFVRMGTTSFFSVIWCSTFSVIGMIGMLKFLIVLALAALVGYSIGFTLAILVVVVSGIVSLWFYGSFWTTSLFIFLGGLAFMLRQERVALLITTLYSVYCTWTYVGWLGLLLSLNLSFISSDILIYFLKNNINQDRRSNESHGQSPGTQGQPGFFNNEHASSSENTPGFSSVRSAGIPSTSGADLEINSEDEVVRLLNCTDHYTALGLSRYQDIDVSFLKREYRKKAMLVHPDKNMGNEKAAEAFKKLQNAYEVLLDSLKRKAYDDELRREELLSVFRNFHNTPRKNGGRGFFASEFARSETGDDSFGESRQIACKKCGNFHVWVHTRKQKSQARWCQDCQDFHQAKDGDGWVEQSCQPFLFGLLQKVDAPSAYVCADSRIYDATEWYICQGMRCPANTHKPSFHVNTSLTSKHNTGKGTSSSSGQKGGRTPTSNMEESMTEEEFFEWLQNAVQAGMFDNFSGSTSTESPSARAGNGTKNTATNSGSGCKRKKKGKKQW
ncbi:DnaJ [Quillaja saponaria]|uniref:DnaJ n=1 Tax=Quillaja saponaria TaxID=32244 RepID=A0AAD7PGZ7_QUISA|nr:DnaJ [Quillaja saponaria]KAJ7955271.1 DnaJ [Quillaja saponaria]